MVLKSSSLTLMSLAQELQKKELYIDAYLKPVLVKKEACKNNIRRPELQKFSPIILSKKGFPVHKLLLAAVSPFFKSLFQDHYLDHCEGVITVLLPETSSIALHYVLHYVYTGTINIPSIIEEEVIHLAKRLQINCLLYKLDLNAKTPEKLKKEIKKTLPKNKNIHDNNYLNHFPSSSKERSTTSKYESRLYEHNSSPFRKSENPKSANQINKKGQNRGPPDKMSAKMINPGSKVWLNTSPTRNLLYIEPNHKAENILFLTNAGVGRCDPLLNPALIPQTCQETLFQVESEMQSSISIQASAKSSNLSLSGLSSESFSDISYPDTSTSNQEVIPIRNEKQVSPLEHASKDEHPNFFGSDQVHNFEQSEVDLPLGSNAEQEEEKKLQVLLKECEGIDLGGRSFNRPPSPMKQFSSSLPSSASEDFIDEINEWIHSDSMKNLKTASKKRSAGSDDVKPKFNYEASSASSEEKKVSIDERNLQPSPILKTSSLNANDVIKADTKKSSDAGSVPHKKDSSKVMKCKVCSKAFKLRNRHDLYIHEARHGIPTLPCKICSKVFKLKKDLSAHMKSHDKEHRFKCDICEKRLCSRRNLQMHVAKIHENKKPYKCELCAKVYGKQASLKVHIRSVHTREKPYKCTYCPKAFASSDLLAIHKSIHSNNLKYICSICQKGFRSFANLFSHKKIHLKEKVFSCSVCKLEFKCHLSLLKHKITHKRFSRPLKCRHCEHAFDLKESYEMHMLSIHKEKVKIAEINIKMNAPNVLHKSAKSFQLPTLNLSSKSANVENSGLECSVPNGKPVRVIHWPPKLIEKAARLNPEAASVSPNLKLKLIEPTSMDKNIYSETALSESLKTDSSNGTSGSLFLNVDHFQCPPASSNYIKDSDHFLQISDISLSSFPSSSTSSKDNGKLWPLEPKPNREIRSLNLLPAERHPLKFLPTADYKLADHISNFSYNMPDTNSSYESNNCDKGESNFLDTFASKCSAEEDNMEKFLFEDISSFVE